MYISLEKSSDLGNKLCAVEYKALLLSIKKIFFLLTRTFEITPSLSLFKKSERFVLMIFYAGPVAKDNFRSKISKPIRGRMHILGDFSNLNELILNIFRSSFMFFIFFYVKFY